MPSPVCGGRCPKGGRGSSPHRSPRIAQLAQLQEHRALVGLLGQVGKRFAQFRDHRRAGQPEERVDLALDLERRDVGLVGVLARSLSSISCALSLSGSRSSVKRRLFSM